ncbi:hypothetical protein Tco_0390729 [Tanacetum coccineum]
MGRLDVVPGPPDQQIANETPTPRLHVRIIWEDPEDDIIYMDIECEMPPVHSPVQTLSSLLGAQLKLHKGILHNDTQRLDALPPTLFEGLRSLEQGQEQATITFGALWRPVLALEVWAGHSDAQRADLLHAWYEDQREIHDLRMQHTAD